VFRLRTGAASGNLDRVVRRGLRVDAAHAARRAEDFFPHGDPRPPTLAARYDRVIERVDGRIGRDERVVAAA